MTQYSNNQPDYGHNPYAGGPPAEAEAQSNTVGLVGFIISLGSIITCGVLAPIGLVVSIIGLFKRPRGFAIAGAVIGAVLSLFGLIFGIGIVYAMLGLKKAGGIVQQGAAIGMAEVGVQDFYNNNGRLPDDAEFDQVLHNQAAQAGALFGGNFEVEYRYEPIDATSWRMTVPGFDGAFGTGDDISETYTVSGFGTTGGTPAGGTPQPIEIEPAEPEEMPAVEPETDMAPAESAP